MPDKRSNDAFDAMAERQQNTVGRTIAEARRKKRWSLAALSKELAEHGVMLRSASINKWERGENIPNAYQLLALCHTLGIEDVLDRFSS